MPRQTFVKKWTDCDKEIKEILYSTLVKHEGWRNRIYEDSKGIPTIGVGFNLLVGLYDEEIDFILNFRIELIFADAKTGLPWFKKLSIARKIVVLDMIYNLGMRKFLGFRRTIAAIKAEDWEEAAREMLDSVWAQEVGIRATRLAEVMRTDILGPVAQRQSTPFDGEDEGSNPSGTAH